MFWNLLKAEQTKIFKRWIVWVILALLVALTLIGNIVQTLTLPGDLNTPEAVATIQNITWPEAMASLPSMGSAAGLGSILILILVGVVMGQEYGWRSLHLWLSEGFSRPSLMSAKILILVLVAFLMVVTPLLVGGIHSIFLTQQFKGGLNLAEVDLVQVGLSVLRGIYSLMPYVALGLLLAVLSRSVVVPVAGGLIAVLIFESLIPQLLSLLGESWGRLGLYFPQGLATALMMANRATSSIDAAMAAPPVAPAAAALGIAAWTAVLLGLAFLAFRQQDLTG